MLGRLYECACCGGMYPKRSLYKVSLGPYKQNLFYKYVVNQMCCEDCITKHNEKVWGRMESEYRRRSEQSRMSRYQTRIDDWNGARS